MGVRIRDRVYGLGVYGRGVDCVMLATEYDKQLGSVLLSRTLLHSIITFTFLRIL